MKDEKARRQDMRRQGGGDRSKTEKDGWKSTRRQKMRGQDSNAKVKGGNNARWRRSTRWRCRRCDSKSFEHIQERSATVQQQQQQQQSHMSRLALALASLTHLMATRFERS